MEKVASTGRGSDPFCSSSSTLISRARSAIVFYVIEKGVVAPESDPGAFRIVEVSAYLSV